jgi:serine/threonine protein phosphatase 1
MAQTYVIGDIHGAYRALLQCLERSAFDYAEDHLICLGDVCDGWPETRQSINELLQIKNLTYVLGNHDVWAIQWMKTNSAENLWESQGGAATIESYKDGVPPSHISLLEKAKLYFVSGDKLFVHAGITPGIEMERQDLTTLLWDRSLVRKAWELFQNNESRQLTQFEEVYVGHTPVMHPQPVRSCEIWMMDTGAGWSGVLSLMNVNTKEVFTSDPVPSLYPGVVGRRRAH